MPSAIASDAPQEYCGLYAVYGAAKILGKEIEFQDLLEKKYINANHGSSAPELMAAIKDHGLSCRVLSGLGIESLRRAPNLLILHVASGEQLAAYDHWMLMIDCDGDRALTIDPEAGQRWIPLAQLLAKWDGNAIAIDKGEIAIWEYRLAGLMRYAMLATICLFISAAAFRFKKSLWLESAFEQTPGHGNITRILVQSAALVIFGFAAGIAYHLWDSSGFFYNRGVTNFVAASLIDTQIPSHSLEEVRKMHELGTAVIIDARFAPDFERGHISGAISLPIDASAEERDRVLAKIGKNQNIVLYCQSEGCRFANTIANGMVREGYEKVSVFPGGWVEWSKN